MDDSFKKANSLIKEGRFAEAEKILLKLYEANPLGIYLQNLQLIKRKTVLKESREMSSGKRRILFVTSGIKGPTPGGGIATCFYGMARTLAETGDFQVSILYAAHPYYHRKDHTFWKNHYEQSYGIQFEPLITDKKNYGSQEMQRSYAIWCYLLEREGLYDCVVFHDYTGLAFFSLLGKRWGLGLSSVDIVISSHGNHTLSYHYGMKKMNTWGEKVAAYMERESLRLAECVTTPSQYYANWIQQEFQVSGASPLPNIVLKEPEGKGRLALEFEDPQRQLLVFYGRVERLKGLDVFLGVLEELYKRGEKRNVIFAGNIAQIDGIDSQKYVTSRISGFGHGVQWVLNCEAEVLYRYVASESGICVFPTLGETSSCVVVECATYGVKFVASDIPAIKELLKPDNHPSYLFSTGSVPALLEQLSRPIPVPDQSILNSDLSRCKASWVHFFATVPPQRLTVVAEKSTPLVTVVVPTADRPLLLEQSLRSLRQQTYSAIEIIVVDDCSANAEDNRQIAESFGAQYHFLKEKVYKGRACNYGVEKASGDFILFFDDDDIAKPGMLDLYMKVFSVEKDAAVISCFADYFDHGDLLKNKEPQVIYTSLALGGGLDVNLSINFFGKGTFIVKKSVFDLVGGYEVDTDAVPMVDYRFYLKCAAGRQKILVVPLANYFYRKNSPNSLFYENKDRRMMQFLAKKSIEKIMEKSFGSDVARGFSPMIWNLSLPKYD